MLAQLIDARRVEVRGEHVLPLDRVQELLDPGRPREQRFEYLPTHDWAVPGPRRQEYLTDLRFVMKRQRARGGELKLARVGRFKQGGQLRAIVEWAVTQESNGG